jgi:hypothetical protein
VTTTYLQDLGITFMQPDKFRPIWSHWTVDSDSFDQKMRKKISFPPSEKNVHPWQGDQIGRIFAHWAIVNFG